MKFTVNFCFLYLLFVCSVSNALAIGPYIHTGTTVYDQATGLIWQQRTGDTDNDGDITYYDTVYWGEALAYCEGLNLAEQSDWRLPNIRELKSIIDRTTREPSINETYFQCESSRYFSSTIWYSNSSWGNRLWYVGFRNGSSYTSYNEAYVRCVRSGLPEQIDQSIEIPLNGSVQSDLPPTSIETNFGTLSPLPGSTFNPSQDTFVISHGWNTGESTDTPGWQEDMGNDLQNKTGVSGGNILLWNWQEKAKSNHLNLNIVQLIKGVPYNKVRRSGVKLSNALYAYLQPYNYQGKIHMIGHSLGSGVVIFATKNLQYRSADEDYEVDHLTLLDSPWYYSPPGGLFLLKNKSNLFVDNYYTIYGRGIYPSADANVWMHLISTSTVDSHGTAHEWYRSSISNFDRRGILEDLDEPSTEQPYGFYWHESSHQNNIDSTWLHLPNTSKWKLISKGTLKKARGKVIDEIHAEQELQKKTLYDLKQTAKETASDIKLLAVTTFNEYIDAFSYAPDQAGHAFWDYIAATSNGRLRLVLNSEAIVSVPITIPLEATSMQFSYKFLAGGDPDNKLEAFIENAPLFTAVAGVYIDNEGNMSERSEWIDVSNLAGEQLTLSFRFSNPTDGPLGEIAIDDIIFAKISSARAGFPWLMFMPAINGNKIPPPPNTCDASHLNLCISSGTCTAAGGFWYSNLCNSTLPAGTVISAGQVWMDRNLGASRVATSLADAQSYGDLYQWGRGTDGHEKRSSSVTLNLSSQDNPGHNLFIESPSGSGDWRDPKNQQLWQGVHGTNNPCPTGFRLPTELEFDTERKSWSSNDPVGAFASPLKLVSAGSRRRDDATLQGAGDYGMYWTQDATISNSRSLAIAAGTAYFDTFWRAYGMSIRCIRDNNQ